jgi:hypothetical protein
MDIRTGQRVRVTFLTDVVGTDYEALNALFATREPGERFPPPQKIYHCAGDQVEGVVTAVVDRFFDVTTDNGEIVGFTGPDSSIRIELLSEP